MWFHSAYGNIDSDLQRGNTHTAKDAQVFFDNYIADDEDENGEE